MIHALASFVPGNESRFTSSFFYILGEQNKLLNLLLSQAKTGGTVNPACATLASAIPPARQPLETVNEESTFFSYHFIHQLPALWLSRETATLQTLNHHQQA